MPDFHELSEQLLLPIYTNKLTIINNATVVAVAAGALITSMSLGARWYIKTCSEGTEREIKRICLAAIWQVFRFELQSCSSI